MTPTRVYMEPVYEPGLPDRAEGGIRRVVEALGRYLPEHGFQLVRELERAELAVGHATNHTRLPSQPFVACCHGLMWADYQWDAWAHDTNRAVIEGLVQAQAITVPSQWVRRAVARGLLRRPEVIYHGIEAAEWQPAQQPGRYVLWNKARADSVSDPREMQKLAAHMLDAEFVTTVGRPAENVRVIGVQPQPQLRAAIEGAGVYLATARETFGIGTLEALAAGVPVAGWAHGGQREIIVEGQTGYLAPFGDYPALAEAVRKCLAERTRLSANARADALERWGWAGKVAQYADLFRRVLAGWTATGPEVSIIITCHNLGRYLPEALASVRAQGFQNWECLVVDDDSTDDTGDVAASAVAQDSRFAYLRTPRNLGLSGARNYGAANAAGRYLLFLDADDCLAPTALGILAGSLVASPGIHIVYGKLALMQADGPPKVNSWPDGEFDWRGQLAHNNQLPYAALQRREVWVETGGYRERMWRAEDADYWARATSFGFRAARVTDQATLHYRLRPDSKGQTEYRTYPDKDGPWTNSFPWNLGLTYAEGRERYLQPGQPHAELVPFAAQGTPTINRGYAWNAYHHETPAVSVIIPVGPGHRRFVLDALDSLMAQDIHAWEAVVVNDTGEAWPSSGIEGAPWARVVSTEGHKGAGAARNLGLREARGALVYFLDADDQLVPGALRKALRAYTEGRAAYIYSDCLTLAGEQRTEVYHRTYDYSQKTFAMQHGMPILIAREHALAAGPFDETLAAWEDWDWIVNLAVQGYCGLRVPEALYIYRMESGARRLAATNEKGVTPLGRELLATLKGRYGAYETGEKPMADCCPGGGEAILAAKRAIRESLAAAEGRPVPAEPQTTGLGPVRVRLEFIGDTVGARSFHGLSGEIYRAGNNPRDRYIDAQASDVDRLVGFGLFRVVRLPEPPPEVFIDPDPMPALDRTAVEPEPELPPVVDGLFESAFGGNGVDHAPKPVAARKERKSKKTGRQSKRKAAA